MVILMEMMVTHDYNSGSYFRMGSDMTMPIRMVISLLENHTGNRYIVIMIVSYSHGYLTSPIAGCSSLWFARIFATTELAHCQLNLSREAYSRMQRCASTHIGGYVVSHGSTSLSCRVTPTTANEFVGACMVWKGLFEQSFTVST